MATTPPTPGGGGGTCNDAPALTPGDATPGCGDGDDERADEVQRCDVILLGTDLVLALLSGMLAMTGRVVIVFDRGSVYGGQDLFLRLDDLLASATAASPPLTRVERDALGRARDYNIDATPLSLRRNDAFLRMLLHVDAARYLDFVPIAAAFSYTAAGARLHAVPLNERRALASSLVGITRRNRLRQLVKFAAAFRADDAATHALPRPLASGGGGGGGGGGNALSSATFADVLAAFGLDAADAAVDCLGAAMGGGGARGGQCPAPRAAPTYVHEPAVTVLQRLARYLRAASDGAASEHAVANAAASRAPLCDAAPSPHVYCAYGLAEVPQAFARLAAVHGGTVHLDVPIDGIDMDADGAFRGVRVRVDRNRRTVRCLAPHLAVAPQYLVAGCAADGAGAAAAPAAAAAAAAAMPAALAGRVEPRGRVVRAFSFLSQPVPRSGNASSCVITLPARQLGRQHDITVLVVGHEQLMAPADHWLAIASTIVESDTPERELDAALQLYAEHVLHTAYRVTPTYGPVGDGAWSRVHVAASLDAHADGDAAAAEAARLFQAITGAPPDLGSRTLGPPFVHDAAAQASATVTTTDVTPQ